MPRPAAAIRHAAIHPLAFTATALTVLVTTVLAAAAMAFASAVAGAAARSALGASPSRAVLVTDQVPAASAGASGRRVVAVIRGALPGLPVTFTAGRWSDYLDLPRNGPGGQQAQVRIITLPGLAAHAALSAGSWPAAGPGPVQVAVPVAAARLLRLAPGDALTVHDSLNGAPLRARVTGIFRPDHPASPYWLLDPIGGPGVRRSGGFSIYGPLVTSPAAAAGHRIPAGPAAWLAVPDAARLTAPNLGALGARLGAALGEGNSSGMAGLPEATVTTSLPALLQGLGAALVVARSQLLIGVLILLLTAGAALAVSVHLLASQRVGEITLLAARGASRRQLASRGAAEALTLAMPAAIIGPLAAARLAPLPAQLGSLAAHPLRLGPAIPAAAWLAAFVTAAGAALIVAVPWLRAPQSPVQRRAQAGRQWPVATIVAAGGDVALVALAVLAGWQLASYQAPVSAGWDGTLGIDPVLVLAPVLALAAGTVVMLRLLPWVIRLCDRAAARGRGITVALASWQLSRRPLRQAGPALLAVLAVATAVITLAQHASWQRSIADQAGFAVGADERIILPPAAPLALGTVAGVTAAPGVSASTPAVRTTAIVGGGQVTTLLALDARAAAGIVPLRADLATRPPAALLRGLAPAGQQPGVLVPGRPARLRITAELGRSAIAGAELGLQLTDAAGIGYRLTAGALPADGRPHPLSVTLSPARRADYPLRLAGYTLSYFMPLVRPQAVQLKLESAGTAATTRNPFGIALPAAPPRGRLLTSVAAQSDAGLRQPPRLAGVLVSPSGAVVVRFTTGAGGAGPASRIPAGLTVTAGPGTGAMPGLATAAFLAATGQHVGATVGVGIDGTTVPVRLAGSLSRFPTLGGAGNGLIVDQATLQNVLRAAGLAPVPVTEWWLRTSGTPRVAGLPPGSSVARRGGLASSLGMAPLSAAPQQALPPIAAAAALLAMAGFVVSVATAQERSREVALLDALGTPPRRLAGLLCLQQAMLSVPAAAAGLVLGFLLSQLIIPAVSLTPEAARPVPPVLVDVPWAPAVGIAAAIAAVPVLAAGTAASRRARAARLRVEEET